MASCVFFGSTSRVVESCSTTRASCTRVTANSSEIGMTRKKMAPRMTIGIQKSFDSMSCLRSVLATVRTRDQFMT